jgi:hypothetical protein
MLVLHQACLKKLQDYINNFHDLDKSDFKKYSFIAPIGKNTIKLRANECAAY